MSSNSKQKKLNQYRLISRIDRMFQLKIIIVINNDSLIFIYLYIIIERLKKLFISNLTEKIYLLTILNNRIYNEVNENQIKFTFHPTESTFHLTQNKEMKFKAIQFCIQF